MLVHCAIGLCTSAIITFLSAFVCLSDCLFVCLFLCLFVCLIVCLFVCSLARLHKNYSSDFHKNSVERWHVDFGSNPDHVTLRVVSVKVTVS